MTELEKKDIFTSRKCTNQIEFEEVMAQINDAQSKENQPYKDDYNKYVYQGIELENARYELYIQLNNIKQQKLRITKELKEINRKWHNLKHEWIMQNPREDFVKEK